MPRAKAEVVLSSLRECRDIIFAGPLSELKGSAEIVLSQIKEAEEALVLCLGKSISRSKSFSMGAASHGSQEAQSKGSIIVTRAKLSSIVSLGTTLSSTQSLQRNTLLASVQAQFFVPADIAVSDEGTQFTRDIQSYLSRHGAVMERMLERRRSSANDTKTSVCEDEEDSERLPSYVGPSLPLPMKKEGRFWCTIWLPKSIRGVPLPITKTMVLFKETHKVENVIKQVRSKCNRMSTAHRGQIEAAFRISNPLEDAKLDWTDSNIILRVAGREDYLDKDMKIMDSKSVREALRHNEPIDFVIETSSTNVSYTDSVDLPSPLLPPPRPPFEDYAFTPSPARRIPEPRSLQTHSTRLNLPLPSTGQTSRSARPRPSDTVSSAAVVPARRQRMSRSGELKDDIPPPTSHSNTSSANDTPTMMTQEGRTWLSKSDVFSPFSVKLRGVDENSGQWGLGSSAATLLGTAFAKFERVLEDGGENIRCWLRARTLIYVGDQVRPYSCWKTPLVSFTTSPRWCCELSNASQPGPLRYMTTVKNLPKNARLAIFICITDNSKEVREDGDHEAVIAWVSIPLMDYNDVLLCGKQAMRLWQLISPTDQASEDLGVEKKKSKEKKPKKRKHPFAYGAKVANWLESAHNGEISPEGKFEGTWRLPECLTFLINTPPYENPNQRAPLLYFNLPEFVLPAMNEVNRSGTPSSTNTQSNFKSPPPVLPSGIRRRLRTNSLEKAEKAVKAVDSKSKKINNSAPATPSGPVKRSKARDGEPAGIATSSSTPFRRNPHDKFVTKVSTQFGPSSPDKVSELFHTKSRETTSRFEQLLMDPMEKATSSEGESLIKMYPALKEDARILPRILSLLNWGDDPAAESKAIAILSTWTPPENPLLILPLLSGRFTSKIIRQYAVACLRRVDNNRLATLLPQFLFSVHAETYHWSSLVRFLLDRAAKNPFHVGFCMAYHLRASLSIPRLRERSALLLQALLGRCTRLRRTLDAGMKVFHQVAAIALRICELRAAGVHTDTEVNHKLREALGQVNKIVENLPSRSIALPYDPRIRVGLLIPDECKFLKSKKTPLWLVFQQPERETPSLSTAQAIPSKTSMRITSGLNSPPVTTRVGKPRLTVNTQAPKTNSLVIPDMKATIVPPNTPQNGTGSRNTIKSTSQSKVTFEATESCAKDKRPIRCIFKAGDDIRQDMLTVQALRLMDEIWLKDGLDLRLQTYCCIATEGPNKHGGMGFIQVVENAKTKGAIQRDYGGRVGAFRQDVILKFLEDKNPRKNDLKKALDNYKRSLAGYCVASYVLGLGDRHSDNVMLRKDGCLFHIDFGHFLGHFKSKWGIRREREAFLLTPAMAYPMGGPKWKNSKIFRDFKTLCVCAYLSIRRHAPELLYLFEAMIPANMPQLTCHSDLKYIRERLMLHLTASRAELSFRGEIQRSLGTMWRRFDDFIHDNVHFKE